MRSRIASASASISVQRAALLANPRGPAAACSAAVKLGWDFKCGAVSRTHLVRTLCICVKIAAMVRDLPGGLAFPHGRVKMFDQDLVDAIVGGKDPDCAPAECVWTLG